MLPALTPYFGTISLRRFLERSAVLRTDDIIDQGLEKRRLASLCSLVSSLRSTACQPTASLLLLNRRCVTTSTWRDSVGLPLRVRLPFRIWKESGSPP